MTLVALLIPKEQEATVVPKINALMRASIESLQVPTIQPQVIETEVEVMRQAIVNAGAGSNYTVVQDQTVVSDESAGNIAVSFIS